MTTRYRRRILTCLLAAASGATVALGVAAGPGVATAAAASQFDVVNGSIRGATGTPAPPGGVHASLWGNRSVATTTLEGSGRVVIGAVGDHCRGWPRLSVSVDGVPVGTTRIVDAKRYGSYPVGRAVGPGRHTVEIRFVNDYRDADCDRNVHLAYARMETPGTTAAAPRPAPAPAPAPQPAPAPAPVPAPVPAPAPPPVPAPPVETPDDVVVPDPAPLPTPPQPGPPPATAPGPGNTGVPAGTALTVHRGDLVVTRDGTVVDGLDIRGFLDIRANDVTVRNSYIRGRDPGSGSLKALVSAYGDHRNLVIEDSTVRPDTASPWLDGIKGRHFTARRVDVSGVVDNAVVFGDDVLIEHSWFHDTTRFSPWPLQPDDQTHNDNLQIEGGSGIVVRGNTFEGASNAAIMITQNYSRTSGVLVEGNSLSGGNCTVNIAEKGKGPVRSTFTGNRFGSSGIPNCAIVSAPSSAPRLEGNTWEGTSTPISLRNRSD